jgi:hypothetical protein
MMPIATIPLVTADQVSCRLAAADHHAWLQCASTAPSDHSFVPAAKSTRLVSAIIGPFGPPRLSAHGPHRRPLHRRPQSNPHNAR